MPDEDFLGESLRKIAKGAGPDRNHNREGIWLRLKIDNCTVRCKRLWSDRTRFCSDVNCSNSFYGGNAKRDCPVCIIL